MKKAMNVGIVGLGDISGIYLQNIVERYHQLKVVAVCDILYERAGRERKVRHPGGLSECGRSGK